MIEIIIYFKSYFTDLVKKVHFYQLSTVSKRAQKFLLHF